MLTRRQFNFGLAAAASAASFGAISLSSCSGDTIKGILNTVLDAASAILAVADPNSPWYLNLAKSIAALKQAETQWLAGGAVTLIDDALNTVSAVLAVIPLTAVYAPLIAVLVAGIEAVLALIPQPTPAAAAKAFNARAQRAATGPYVGKVTLTPPHWLQTHAGAFREQWNATAKGLGLTKAYI